MFCENGATPPPVADADDAANFISVGFLEAGMRVHFAGDPPNACGWFGAVVRGRIGLGKPSAQTTVGSSYVESPPGVSFYGLFGSNF